jgi:hypothetical protein
VAGYSNTPLVKKLGIKPGFSVVVVNAPPKLLQDLQLPADIALNPRAPRLINFALLFVKNEKELTRRFKQLAARLQPAGMLWIAWPKKSAGIATDLSFTNVQAAGLKAGMVDTKICAIDDTWSGLKFVYRLKDR